MKCMRWNLGDQFRLFGACMLLAVVGLAAGCSSGAGVRDNEELAVEAESLPEAPADDETSERLRLMEQAQRRGAEPPAEPFPSERFSSITPAERLQRERPAEPASHAPDEESVDASTSLDSPVVPESDAPAQTEQAGAPTNELVAQLASMLSEQARASDAPAAALLRLAALEILEPGVSTSVGEVEGALTPQEKQFLAAWREMLAAARDELTSTGDLGPLAARVSELAERFQSVLPLSVSGARLCEKVDGFGMYRELPGRTPAGTYRVLVGRITRAIVYVELLNYAQTPKSSAASEGYEVRLTQELMLYQEGREQDVEVWRRDAAPVVEWSRNRRTDFYTTQIIAIPASLGVGTYRLKVRIEDKASGAIAETVIPIEVVTASMLAK